MIVATDIELRAGARLLLEGASFQVAAGDRIGLVGRNGAGKTTLAKVLAGQAQPAAGSVRRSGAGGYLPPGPGSAPRGPACRGGAEGRPGLRPRSRGHPPLRAARGAARGTRRVRGGV